MRVSAIKDSLDQCPPAVAGVGSAASKAHISLGKQYQVHAVSIVRGVVLFQIIDDSQAITWLPAWLFETSDSSVPKDWICNWFATDPQMVLGAEFVASSQASYHKMVALDPVSVAAFRSRLASQSSLAPESESPPEVERTAAHRPLPPAVLKLAALVVSLIIAALLGEVALRLFFSKMLSRPDDERSLMYRYDKTLGWFPLANRQARLFGSRAFGVTNNSEGFRAPERTAGSKPGIVFLGDSFVWGYDVEAAERFTDKLQTEHPDWTIYNLGVSGYGTDQEYLLLNQHFDAYKPRVVFLLFCVETDHDDNSSNIRYGGYYKPYCTILGNRLQLQGIPVPRGERVFFAEHRCLARSALARLLVISWFKVAAPRELHNPDPTGAIIRDLQKYVASKGSVFVMGLTRSNPRLEEFLRYFKIPYVDLATSERYAGFGEHWTPQGHTFVCDKIDRFLVEGKYLSQSP